MKILNYLLWASIAILAAAFIAPNLTVSRADQSVYKFGQYLNNEVGRQWQYRETWDTSCPAHDGDLTQQGFICRAWKISGGHRDFILTLKAENGRIDPLLQSYYYNKAGHREPSYGFCQIHSRFHPDIVGDERFFTDPHWQLDQCWRLYSDYERRGIVGKRFYGYNNRWKVERYFKFN